MPYVIAKWHTEHPDPDVPDGLLLTQPRPATQKAMARGTRDRVIHYR